MRNRSETALSSGERVGDKRAPGSNLMDAGDQNQNGPVSATIKMNLKAAQSGSEEARQSSSTISAARLTRRAARSAHRDSWSGTRCAANITRNNASYTPARCSLARPPSAVHPYAARNAALARVEPRPESRHHQSRSARNFPTSSAGSPLPHDPKSSTRTRPDETHTWSALKSPCVNDEGSRGSRS